MRGIALLVLSVLLALPSLASANGRVRSEDFASDRNWLVYTDIPTSAFRQGPAFIGKAQRVCLNALAPSPCPSGATVYGWPGAGGWTANLAPIPDAKWIWAPGVTGATIPADNASYVFAQHVSIPRRAVVTEAVLSVSADDMAAVYVNGVLVGTVGSVTDAAVSLFAQSNLTSFSIAPWITGGRNVVAVVGTNGPASFGGCPTACSYAQNPAGVVFGGFVKYVLPKKP
jgi:hypothetical protein